MTWQNLHYYTHIYDTYILAILIKTNGFVYHFVSGNVFWVRTNCTLKIVDKVDYESAIQVSGKIEGPSNTLRVKKFIRSHETQKASWFSQGFLQLSKVFSNAETFAI